MRNKAIWVGNILKQSVGNFLTGKEMARIHTYFIFSGFFIGFIIFFVVPAFILPSAIRIGANFGSPLYFISPTGYDWKWNMNLGRVFLGYPLQIDDGTTYDPTQASPFAILIFGVIGIFFTNHHAYLLLIGAILLSYFAIHLFLTKHNLNQGQIINFIFALGLMSYGFWFEVERGQHSFISFVIAIGAVFLFHRSKSRKTEFLSLVLFAISVHLKYNLATFGILFIRSGDSIRAIIERFVSILVLFILLFFSAGTEAAIKSIELTQEISSRYLSNGVEYNHSILGFYYWHIVNGNSMCVTPFSLIGLYAFLMIVTLLCMYFLYKYGFFRFAGEFITLVCLLSLLFPTLSIDYRLSILIIPISIFIDRAFEHSNGINVAAAWRENLTILIIQFVTSFAFAAMIIPVTIKHNYQLIGQYINLFVKLPTILRVIELFVNNFFALFVILTCATAQLIIKAKRLELNKMSL